MEMEIACPMGMEMGIGELRVKVGGYLLHTIGSVV